jgi:hypothetical protein
VAKFLDYEGLSYYTEKVRGNMNTIADQSIVYNIMDSPNLKQSSSFNATVVKTDTDVTVTSTNNYGNVAYKIIVEQSETYMFSSVISDLNIVSDSLKPLIIIATDTNGHNMVTSKNITSNGQFSVKFTATTTNLYILYESNGTGNSFKSADNRLSKKDIYDSFPIYQPYALSNVQITDFIQTPANTTDIDNIWDSI